MAQNIYDDAEFFAAYSALDRSTRGLDGAPEWPTLRSLMPDVRGRDVLDLGCGFGWFARWAIDHGASSVLGIDVSERMLDRARRETASARVALLRGDLDTVELPVNAFDVAFSSLTLHYLADLPTTFARTYSALRPDGTFVFSSEHPLLTAPSTQRFVTGADGRVTWPLNGYLDEGPRTTNWLAPGVVKQHRTIATVIAALIGAGFTIDALIEWGPSEGQVKENPAWSSERERPMFLMMRATRRTA